MCFHILGSGKCGGGSMSRQYRKNRTRGGSKRGGGSAAVAVQEREPREEMLELEAMWHKMRVYEARVRAGQQTKSAAWDESEALGIPPSQRRNNQLSERELKDTLCKAYLNMPWISACIDARVLRMISGTWELVPTCDDADESVRDEILELLLFVNDDEDLMQLLYSYGLDIMIYGEGYMEIVRGGNGKPADQPTQLHKVDCQTMTYKLDEHGAITGYEQNLEHATKPIPLTTDQIMRTWFPSPESNKKALSPVFKLMGAAMLYEQMMDWARKFFKKGARPPFSFEHPGEKRKALDFLTWLKEEFTGPQNAHIPLVTYDGVKIQYAPQGPVEMDFLKGLEWVRQETMSNLQTPPANIAVIESGNIGGGTGDSQQKTFVNNAVKPLERIILEKFNYVVIQKGFKTKQWKLVLHPASYEDDSKTTDNADKRIRNGSMTINEARKQAGDAAYEDGVGDTPVFAVTKEVMPVDRLSSISDEQAQQAQIDIQTKQAQAEKAKADAERAKEPPQPVPAQLQQQGGNPPDGTNDQQETEPQANTPGGKNAEPPVGNGKSQKESDRGTWALRPRYWTEWQEEIRRARARNSSLTEAHAGIMVAFAIDPDVAAQLAIPGGEPASEMHITLAYLPESTQYSPEQLLTLKALVAAYAEHAAPLEGIWSGIGRFTPSESSDGMAPVYASPNVHGLHELRDELVHMLLLAGFDVAHTFAFTPHCTLLYADADAPIPNIQLPTTPLRLQTLLLAIGEEHLLFPLTGEHSQHTGESDTSLTAPPDSGAWQDGYPGISATLDDYTARGVVELEWDASGTACDQCMRNHGVRVKVGEQFPTGAYTVPNHDRCECVVNEIFANGTKQVGYGAGPSLK